MKIEDELEDDEPTDQELRCESCRHDGKVSQDEYPCNVCLKGDDMYIKADDPRGEMYWGE